MVGLGRERKDRYSHDRDGEADTDENRTRGDNKSGNGGKRLGSEHVGEYLLEGVDTEAAADAEIGKAENDANQSETDGARDLHEVACLWRVRF